MIGPPPPPPAYVAPASTKASLRLARATLALLFGFTLFYPLIVVLTLVAAWWWPLVTTAVAGLALSSLYWARGPTNFVSHSRVLASWRSYFGLRVWRETPPIEPESAVLFVAVPHGLFPMSLPLLSGPVINKVFPEVVARCRPRAGVASIFFWLPFLAPLVTWLGGVPVHRKTLQALLKGGTSCLLFPDGIAGAFAPVGANGDSEILRIGGRRGFEQLAQSIGVPIIPVYCFGHSQLWSTSWPPSHHWLAQLSRKIRMALVLYWPIVPHASPGLNIVFGPPLKEGQRFDDAIRDLYQRYQEQMAGHSSRKLMITH